MYVVEGSPRARAVSRAALSLRFVSESFCLNSGRIGGAARGRVSRARPCQAPGVCKRADRIVLRRKDTSKHTKPGPAIAQSQPRNISFQRKR